MSGRHMIARERERQIRQEGYSSFLDDRYVACQLRRAASCYASLPISRHGSNPPANWPWPKEAWKPTPGNRICELMRAGALYLAEADRQWRLGHVPTSERMRAKAAACARKIDRILKLTDKIDGPNFARI